MEAKACSKAPQLRYYVHTNYKRYSKPRVALKLFHFNICQKEIVLIDVLIRTGKVLQQFLKLFFVFFFVCGRTRRQARSVLHAPVAFQIHAPAGFCNE